MIIRTVDNNILHIKREDYVSDKEYHKKINSIIIKYKEKYQSFVKVNGNLI